MKRFVCGILAVLLMPVLALPAAAADVYEFEYMEMPVALSHSFVFAETDSMLVYEGLLPPGIYSGSFVVGDEVYKSAYPVALAFDYEYEENGQVLMSSFVDIQMSSGVANTTLSVGFCYLDGMTLCLSSEGFPSGLVLTLERVGDLSSNSGAVLTGFLDTMKTGLQDYNTTNLGTILVFALVLACTPALCWFGYRIIKRKFTKAYFKGRV